MILANSTSLLLSKGFQIIPQTPDFEREDPWATYMRRIGHTDTPTWEGAESTHEYLLIVADRTTLEVIESVYERYLAPKVTRRPKSRAVYKKKGEQVDHYSDLQYKGFYPIHATILRGDEALTAL